MHSHHLDTWELPAWALEVVEEWDDAEADDEARMQLAIDLASCNIAEGTGGPFGAAVFDRVSGRLVSIGVNAVVPSNCSHAHAEMMALARAQRDLGTYDLGTAGMEHELVTSCEPCAMCLGAVPWSGVRRVVCGATDDDARAIGFDEGDRAPDWQESLQSRGIEVVTSVCRAAARDVFQQYVDADGSIYNSRES
ncbi:MAG: nucleoside deaminase [Acidobacteria bacterium]|nr:nucleoside deaminase [Acidobacteriota bacterium]